MILLTLGASTLAALLTPERAGTIVPDLTWLLLDPFPEEATVKDTSYINKITG